jgi:hypothetical protein
VQNLGQRDTPRSYVRHHSTATLQRVSPEANPDRLQARGGSLRKLSSHWSDMTESISASRYAG